MKNGNFVSIDSEVVPNYTICADLFYNEKLEEVEVCRWYVIDQNLQRVNLALLDYNTFVNFSEEIKQVIEEHIADNLDEIAEEHYQNKEERRRFES